MRQLFVSLLMLTAAGLSSGSSAKENITVNIRGMVCAFCAQGITKKFKALPSVEEVKVNLDDKTVKLTVKDQQVLSDDAIREAVTESGFNLVKIDRQK